MPRSQSIERVWVPLATMLAVAITGCSSSTAPMTSKSPSPYRSAPTVWITNPLCDTNGCDTLEVGMFPWAYLKYAPGNPLYGVRLGLVPNRTGCVQIPGLDSLKVGVQDSTETPTNVHTYYWRPDDPDGIYLIMGVYLTRPAIADTKTFIPAAARSWDLTFSPDPDSSTDGKLYTAHLTADAVACMPTS